MFAAKNEERGKGEKGAVVPGSVSGNPGARGRQTHPGRDGRRKINTRGRSDENVYYRPEHAAARTRGRRVQD